MKEDLHQFVTALKGLLDEPGPTTGPVIERCLGLPAGAMSTPMGPAFRAADTCLIGVVGRFDVLFHPRRTLDGSPELFVFCLKPLQTDGNKILVVARELLGEVGLQVSKRRKGEWVSYSSSVKQGRTMQILFDRVRGADSTRMFSGVILADAKAH